MVSTPTPTCWLCSVPGGFAREAVDVMRNLMFAHRAVIRRAGERDAQPAQCQDAVQMPLAAMSPAAMLAARAFSSRRPLPG